MPVGAESPSPAGSLWKFVATRWKRVLYRSNYLCASDFFVTKKRKSNNLNLALFIFFVFVMIDQVSN